MNYQAPRGTRDILPQECRKWHFLEEKAREVSRKYGYGEIRLPLFEHTEVFARSVGEDTDIVSKEMYSFKDRGERYLTLRPEGTASVVRAYLENHLNSEPKPVKLYYYGPMFRYDRPQSGRYRQFYQYGVECFGSSHPASDVEVIMLALDFFNMLGLTGVKLYINSVGCRECRPGYRQKIKEDLSAREQELCPDCRRRLASNPLRVMDCKQEKCRELTQDIPLVTNYLCQGCRDHFDQVREILDAQGVDMEINPRLVRGLDYYTRTAFEFVADSLGAQDSIGGGGRYDNLVEYMGGPSVPAVGLALGIERILLSLPQEQLTLPEDLMPKILVAISNQEALKQGFLVAQLCREAGGMAEVEITGRSLKAQMKFANRKNFDYVAIIGEEEHKTGTVALKNMVSGEQYSMSYPELKQEISKQVPLQSKQVPLQRKEE